jgi:DNA-binding transcriptional LysR family regulator
MDRIEAMKIFVATIDEGSLAGAGRKLGRSPAAVSRAVAFLEAYVGVPLLHRTTRSIRLSEAGEPYASACRRLLADLRTANMQAARQKTVARGTLTLTAPVMAGELYVRPIVDAFVQAYPAVNVRLHLNDCAAPWVDDDIDAALRIEQLADSSLIALPVGEVRRVVVASPRYLAEHPVIREPADLAGHAIIAMTQFGLDAWSFPALPDSATPRSVHFMPRLIVNSVRGAIDSVLAGAGLTRLYSYQVASEVRDGSLRIVLAEADPSRTPVQLVIPHGRLSVPKVRAFADFAVPRLRAHFSGAALPWRASRATEWVAAVQ